MIKHGSMVSGFGFGFGVSGNVARVLCLDARPWAQHRLVATSTFCCLVLFAYTPHLIFVLVYAPHLIPESCLAAAPHISTLAHSLHTFYFLSLCTSSTLNSQHSTLTLDSNRCTPTVTQSGCVHTQVCAFQPCCFSPLGHRRRHVVHHLAGPQTLNPKPSTCNPKL